MCCHKKAALKDYSEFVRSIAARSETRSAEPQAIVSGPAGIRNQTTEANDETNYSDHPSFHVPLLMQFSVITRSASSRHNHYRPQRLLRHSVTTL
jgi:hypothetical protein